MIHKMTDACADGRCSHCKYPVPQPTTMEEEFDDRFPEFRATFKPMYDSAHLLDRDEIISFIKQVEAEAEKRGYSRGYHEGRGQRDFTGREVEPKGL